MISRLQLDPQLPTDEAAFRRRSRELWTDAARVTQELQNAPVCRVDLGNANQSITAAANTTLSLVTGSTYAIDSHGWWNSTTYRYTPQRSGYYDARVQVTLAKVTLDALGYVILRAMRNGSSQALAYWDAFPASEVAPLATSTLIYCDGLTDYISFSVEYETGSGLAVDGNWVRSFATLHWVGDKQAR